jgi:uncharacterized protein (DUF1778 family)
MSLGRTRGGAVLQESIFAGAGGSRVQGLVVLARNAQAFPLMHVERECWIAAGFDAVPLWYHAVMAMNLRLDDDDSALLKALAEAEHVSLHEAALRAIRRSARELAHTDRVREATAEMLDRWGGVLDRLGRA